MSASSFGINSLFPPRAVIAGLLGGEGKQVRIAEREAGDVVFDDEALARHPAIRAEAGSRAGFG